MHNLHNKVKTINNATLHIACSCDSAVKLVLIVFAIPYSS